MSIIAIDFGTSNTVIAIQDGEQERVVRLPGLSVRLDPSVDAVPTLVFVDSQQITIGEPIRAQRLAMRDPQRCFRNFKRDLVADFVPPPRQLDGQAYGSERVAEAFLARLVAEIHAEGIQPTQVILTVPVGAFERYADWLRGVAERLDLPPVAIIDESTAAALGYAVAQPESCVLVVDFGGGTLDLSLVRMQVPIPGETTLKAEVVAKSDAWVGGMDIDTWILERHLAQMGLSAAEVGSLGWQTLLEIAERLKIRLSEQDQVSESWFDDEQMMAHELTLSQPDLASLLEQNHLLDQLRQALDDIVMMAQLKGIPRRAIDRVLLVGGTCRIPAIQTLVKTAFGPSKVSGEQPFSAVALGALKLGSQLQVADHLRHSYALRLWDPALQSHSMIPILPKGSPYPHHCPEPLILQTAQEGQTEIRLDIGQVGEGSQSEVTYDPQGRMTSRQVIRQTDFRPLSGDPICLARLDPVGSVGVDRLRVDFEVDSKRMLRATLRDLLTGQILGDRIPVVRLD
jgi:molecular chaperone DnaK (HSP70)